MRYTIIVYQAIIGLILAWTIKTRKRLGGVQYPSSVDMHPLSLKERSFILRCAHFLVKYGAVWTGRKCFFFAFINAYVLRKWSVPVVMNVGLWNHKDMGHCWLTLNDEPFAEKEDPRSIYTEEIGLASNGVRYWLHSNRTVLK